MTDVSTYRAPHGTIIHQTASDLSDALRIGNAIAGTSFAPTAFRGKGEECAVAILYGQTIGLDPMTAIQQVFVIGGKPALYARAMVAIALAAGHEIWTEEESEGRVTVAGKRRGTDRITTVTWTTEMATRAGYTNNAKYKTDPRSMLYARASGDVARRIAPDALLGLAYNAEELELDPEVAPSQVVTAAVFQPASAPQIEAREGVPGPDGVSGLDGVRVPEDGPQGLDAASHGPVEMITTAQLRKIGAAMKEMGLTGREEALGYVKASIGRDIASRNELTKVEAGMVIDALEDDLAEPVKEPEPVETEQGPVDTDTGELDAAWGLTNGGQA